MLGESKAFSGYSISDVQAAKKFYGETLGLNVSEDACGLSIKLGGGTAIFLYSKPNHQPATFTVLNFPVDNIDDAVHALSERGIIFEQYGGDIATDEKGIFRGSATGNSPDIAWFKDPAGNILSVLSGK